MTRKEVEKEDEKRREKMGDEEGDRGGGEDGHGDGERNGIRVLVVREGLRFSRRQAMGFPAGGGRDNSMMQLTKRQGRDS